MFANTYLDILYFNLLYMVYLVFWYNLLLVPNFFSKVAK